MLKEDMWNWTKFRNEKSKWEIFKRLWEIRFNDMISEFEILFKKYSNDGNLIKFIKNIKLYLNHWDINISIYVKN